MRKEEADKKAIEAESKRKRLEEAEKKRQAMMAAQKEKQQAAGNKSFVIYIYVHFKKLSCHVFTSFQFSTLIFFFQSGSFYEEKSSKNKQTILVLINAKFGIWNSWKTNGEQLPMLFKKSERHDFSWSWMHPFLLA